MSHSVKKDVRKRAILAAAASMVTVSALHADTINWTGTSSGGDGSTWSNALNWTDATTSTHVAPTTPGTTGLGDVAQFYDSGLGGGSSINVTAAASLAGISFGTPTNGLGNNLTLGGSALTVTGLFDSGNNPVAFTRDEGATGTVSVGNNIVLANSTPSPVSQQFNLNGPSGSLTFTGVISSTGAAAGLTKNGDGTLFLGGVNTYTGQTIINSGTLAFNRSNSIPLAGGNVELGAVGSTNNASFVMAFSAAQTSTNTIDVRAAAPSAVLTIGSTTAGNVTNLGQNITLNGNVNLAHDINFFSDIATNGVFGMGTTAAGGGIIQTAPAGFTTANVIKTGNGYFRPGGLFTYYGTTTISNGILEPQNANTTANIGIATAASYTAGATSFTLANVTGLSVGQSVAGPGLPLAATNASIPVITAINTTTNLVTISKAIDPTFTGTAPVGTTLNFGTPNPLGLSSTPIFLGDAATTANGYSAALLTGATRSITRPVTVTNNPTTGVYYIGAGSATVGFSGLITLNQPATILANVGSTLPVTGGVVSANGPLTLTLGSVNTGSFFGSSAATYNSVSDDDTTDANGTTTFSSGAIADGTGKISVVVNAGTQSFQGAETYTGNTTINGGTLRVTTAGTFANSLVINLNSSGGSAARFQAFQSTAAAPFVFAANQKVLGTGTFVSGSATTNGPVQFNGILQTGETNNVAGKTSSTITLVGGSVLNGTTLMDLTDTNQSDQIAFTSAGNATANLGGILTVTNPNGVTLAAGQSYQLFSFGSDTEAGTFSQVNLPVLPTGGPTLTYSLSGLYTNGSITIVNGVTWNNAGGPGDGQTWDTTQKNFNDGTGPAAYTDGEVVTFNDANNGNYNVSIPGTVSPGQVIVSTASAYTFNGSGGIGGNSSLTKTGTGTLNLSNTGANSLGAVVLNQGIVNAAPGTLSNSGIKVSVNPSGTAGNSTDAVTLNSNGSFGYSSAVLVISNSATAIGTLNLVGATESIGSLTGNGSVVLAAPTGTALSIGGDNSSSKFSGVISDGGSGLGSLTKTGTGIFNVAGANTFGGGINLNGGELALGSAGALGTAGTISFNGGALQYSAGITTDYSGRFSNASGQQFNIDTPAGVIVTFASSLNSSGGSLTKTGAGRLNLGVANFYTGTTTIAGGTLALQDAGALGSTSKLSMTSGTLQYAAGTTVDYSSIFSGDPGQAFAIDTNGNNVTFNSVIDAGGGSSLVKLGQGTLTLAQPNGFSGTVQASTGTLVTSVSGGFGTAAVTVLPNGASNNTVADSVTLISGGGIDSNALVTVSNSPIEPTVGIGTLVLTATSENIGGLAGTGVVSLNNSAGTTLTVGNKNTNTVFSGKINDAGTGKGQLIKVGTGQLTLSGASTFSGGAAIDGGILTFANAGALGSAGPILFGGGRLQYSGVATDLSGRIATTPGQNIAIDTNSQLVTFASQINSSGGSLSKIGTGTITFNKLPLVDTITVNGGSVATTIPGGLGVTNFIASTNNTMSGLAGLTTNPVAPILLNVNGGFTSATNLTLVQIGAVNTVTLNLNGSTETIGSITSTSSGGAPKLVLNNSTGTVLTFGNSQSTAIGNAITDNGGKGSVVYVGTGTVTLGIASSFAGGLTQNSGTLTSKIQTNVFGSGKVTVNPTGTSGTTVDAATLIDTVNGGFNASSAVTVNTNSASAIGTINITAATETIGSLAGTGTVSLKGTAGTTLTTGGNGSTTIFSGNITDTSTALNSQLTYNGGSGSFTLSGTNSYGGGTNASTGTLNFAQTASYPAVSNLSIGSLAKVVEISHGTGGPETVLRINTLTNNGLLNLNNNALSIHDPTAFASTYAAVRTGFANGAFNKTTGITSTAAASDTTHLTTLGVIRNDNGAGGVLYGAPTDTLGQFSGTSPSLDDTLVKYTYFGDANLDGQVNSSDYTRIDSGFLSGGTLTGWYNGDFNYDSVINGSDYTLIDNAFNTQGAQLAAAIAPSAIATAEVAPSASVPEPTAIALLGTGAIAVLGRRRRSR